MPEVSIILPTCDRPRLVGRALGSLLAQTFADFEVLLVDANRRTPPVRENPLVVPLLADPRVRVIDGRATRSSATARNAGLDAAGGAWITFLDDDDAYRADKIAAQHALARATGAPMVLCGYELIWPHLRRPRQVDCECFRGDEILTRASLGSPAFFHVRTGAARFDERFTAGEDMRYGLQIVQTHAMTELPCVARCLVDVYQRVDGLSVHANKERVWRAYRVVCFAARDRFSHEARRAFLARGRVERAMGGDGGPGFFCRSLAGMLRTRLPRKWRLAAYAIVARCRR